MAMLISRATGNFTAAATWGVADAATNSQLTNPSASTNTTTSYVYSSTFTGTNTRVADGIVLFLKRLNTTGTVTVALSDDNGVTATREVTVNASDLPADESWVFFKFVSTLTLDGGTDYRVGVVASSAANALIYRNATAGNWARMVSTTLTGAPAAGDTMLIVGEWTGAGASSSYTVTMDNTNSATDFGTGTASTAPSQTLPQTYNGIQVGQNGTLTWAATAATNYYLRLSGHLTVWSGGTYNMGTSGTPCPRDSTMTLQLDSASSTSNNPFQFGAFAGSTVNIYGLSRTAGKNIVSCKLNADASANATTLSVDTDTGWLDNDLIAISATNRVITQDERGALNGNATSTTLTVDGFAGTGGGLAFAHTGTLPCEARVINLTRNVKITGTNNGGAVSLRNAAINVYWAEFTSIANESGGGIANGFSTVNTTNANIAYCSFHTSISGAVLGGLGLATNLTFSNNVIYNFGDSVNISSATAGTSGVLLQNNVVMKPVFGNCIAIQSVNFSGTIDGNFLSGASNGFNLSSFGTDLIFSNNTAYSCSNGISAQIPSTNSQTLRTIANFSGVRCATSLNLTSSNSYVVVENSSFISSTNQNAFGIGLGSFMFYSNCLFACEPAYPTTTNFNTLNNTGTAQVYFNNCTFSPTSSIYSPATNDISLGTNSTYQFTSTNSFFGASTEVLNPANVGRFGFIKSSKHDQTEGAFKSWFQGGIVERDTTIYNTASPSERLTPSSASIKLQSGPRLVAVDDLGTVTINVYVRKSVAGDGAAYNGNQPRLILKANPACGINSDVVLDTMTAAAGSWEQLTGTTAAVDADGALEFVIDCDGTVGWVNADDWSVS